MSDTIRGQATVVRHMAFCVLLVFGAAFCSGSDGGASSCSVALSPASASQPVSGGTGTVAVTTAASCSWTASSDVDWATVTGGNSGEGNGIVTYSVAPNASTSARSGSLEVVHAGDQTIAALHEITQQGTSSAWLPVRGAYTFRLDADPRGTCGWPVTTFVWPVMVTVTSYVQGTTVGSIVFPQASSTASNEWSITTGATGTQLVPGQGSPGPAAAAYDVVVEGGRWVAGGPTRGPDGRGQITDGTASGARLILRLPGSDTRWECSSDAKWSLLYRYIDQD